MTTSVTQYLREGSIIISNSPTYDDKGRQLPFQESPHQRRERHAFVNSLRWQRNVANWMLDQRHERLATADTQSSSSSSSESSSPRTPASPLNTPHNHPDPDTPHQQKMKQQTVAALDAELAKLVLASRQIAPPQHRQSRNYKNLHLPNTTAFRYQPRTRTTSSSQQQRLQAPASTPPRGIFDSTYPTSMFPTYPSLHHTSADQELDSGEPYIFYSSSSSFSRLPSQPSTSPLSITTATSPGSGTTILKPQAAGIGEFPYPASSSRSTSHSRSLSLTSLAPLTSPSSSLSPRMLTGATSATASANMKPRVEAH